MKTIIEPFKIKMVEPIHMNTLSERVELLKKAHYNPFMLQSQDVIIDLLTDSGTSAMSSAQWGAMMEGDESYAGSKSWQKMEHVIYNLTGYKYIIPTHQGRAAERIIYGYLGGKGKCFISNTHFDTTRANIEYSGAEAIDIVIPEGKMPFFEHPFKGNMDVVELERLIQEKGAENIGAVILTVTNNSGGGQPVSMKNTKEVSLICKKYNVCFLIDACRIAENSYFIKHREAEYKNKTYIEIAQEMFSYSDGCTMSAKKDALVNMGGFLAVNNKIIADECMNLLIITEGYVTYGGLSGRDMEAIAVGLEEIFHNDYLTYRIKSTEYLGKKLNEMGVPVVLPIGGHAVYVDAKTLYPQISVDQYPGHSLVCELYLKGGIRSVEIGSLMFGKYDEEGKLIPANMELVRLAIPRRVYTQSHIDYVVEIFEEIIKTKHNVKGYKINYEPKFLRHFTSHLEPLN
ncbi:MAG: tyrosine phenol-lyase [Bacteroidetes bacterium GWE2_29_8]|nr:MAG: tyrosine phenol-lyase [Bacteroidetes bacterium GWE2_29_8]OFY17520.1 MAG: tyrosine phenol-lyase [Bacteroidetes bacterium GWF2_29_10]